MPGHPALHQPRAGRHHPDAGPLRRLSAWGCLQLRPAAQAPHPTRIHLQTMNFRTRPIHQPNPPNAGTKQQGSSGPTMCSSASVSISSQHSVVKPKGSTPTRGSTLMPLSRADQSDWLERNIAENSCLFRERRPLRANDLKASRQYQELRKIMINSSLCNRHINIHYGTSHFT